jgi:outer membrane protein OmpA-like peptidoglycan-associated protein
MNTPIHNSKKLIYAAMAFLFLVACSASMTKPDGADNVRSKLTQLQSNPELASRAPIATKEAEQAVRAAEKPRTDTELSKHLVFMADRKIDIASAQAQSRLLEDQRKALGEQRETARLDSRTLEADKAHSDAKSARADANIARLDAETAKQQAADLQLQITELNAKTTDRGLVVTLGDVLFDTGRSDLKSGTASNLGKLAVFLNKYKDRTVVIEGHTDNVGSENSNLGLSQRRADSVKSYLMSEGVGSSRLAASGKGESYPVTGNDSATGRQQNRRVEVIIANTVSSLL